MIQPGVKCVQSLMFRISFHIVLADKLHLGVSCMEGNNLRSAASYHKNT